MSTFDIGSHPALKRFEEPVGRIDRDHFLEYFDTGLLEAVCVACDNLTVAPPEEHAGLCERCGRNTVATLLVLNFEPERLAV